MVTIKQAKMARSVKEVVSDAVANRLNDPRIEGFVSVTRVEVSPDLRNAYVYLSIFGKDDAKHSKTFAAISHAKARIQFLLAHKLQRKFCPALHFYKDEKFKQTLETLNLIDQAVSNLKNKDSVEPVKD